MGIHEGIIGVIRERYPLARYRAAVNLAPSVLSLQLIRYNIDGVIRELWATFERYGYRYEFLFGEGNPESKERVMVHSAASFGSVEVVEILLDHGVEFEALNIDG